MLKCENPLISKKDIIRLLERVKLLPLLQEYVSQTEVESDAVGIEDRWSASVIWSIVPRRENSPVDSEIS